MFLLVFTAAVSSMSCNQQDKRVVKVAQEREWIIPDVPDTDILPEYNVTVYNTEDPVCAGTVIESTPERTLILTACHCVLVGHADIMDYGFVEFNGDDRYRVEVLGVSRSQDLAMLTVTDMIGAKLTARIASIAPKAGDRIQVAGFACGKEDIMSIGIIAKTDDEWEGTHYMLIDAAVYKGDSGGGVYNTGNELIGVVSRNGPLPDWGLWAYAVHYDEVAKFVARWIKE
jgi:V8-like Glu-specific endopeptidase